MMSGVISPLRSKPQLKSEQTAQTYATAWLRQLRECIRFLGYILVGAR